MRTAETGDWEFSRYRVRRRPVVAPIATVARTWHGRVEINSRVKSTSSATHMAASRQHFDRRQTCAAAAKHRETTRAMNSLLRLSAVIVSGAPFMALSARNASLIGKWSRLPSVIVYQSGGFYSCLERITMVVSSVRGAVAECDHQWREERKRQPGCTHADRVSRHPAPLTTIAIHSR